MVTRRVCIRVTKRTTSSLSLLSGVEDLGLKVLGLG